MTVIVTIIIIIIIIIIITIIRRDLVRGSRTSRTDPTGPAPPCSKWRRTASSSALSGRLPTKTLSRARCACRDDDHDDHENR